MNKNTKVSNELVSGKEQQSNSLYEKDNMLPVPLTVDADGCIHGNLYPEELTGNDSFIAPEEDIAFYKKNLDRMYNHNNNEEVYKKDSSSLSRYAIVIIGILLTILLSACYLFLPKKPEKGRLLFE